ncbi:MAG: hypothetical protein ABIH72_00985 [archaeon]
MTFPLYEFLPKEKTLEIELEVVSEMQQAIEGGQIEDETLSKKFAASTVEIICNFRTLSNLSYDQDYIMEAVPKKFQHFLGREAIKPGKIIDYHRERVDAIKDLVDHFDNPKILISAEKELALMYLSILPGAKNLDFKQRSNINLAANQTEVNMSDIYAMCCLKFCGDGEYILGLSPAGHLYTKKHNAQTNYELLHFFNKAHSHAVTFLSLDPKMVNKVVPDNKVWSEEQKGLENICSESRGKIGIEMLQSGHNHREFLSTTPHEIILGHEHIKEMIVAENPEKKEIYYCTVFADDTISVGMLRPSQEDIPEAIINSGYFADYVMLHAANPSSTYLQTDIAGSIARDMMICNEKHRFYQISEHVQRKVRKKRKKTKSNKIKWIPRFRIITHGEAYQSKQQISKTIRQITPHHVDAFHRKCANPSEHQLMLAALDNYPLPAGCTYVTEHDRGKNTLSRKYKSRSAMQLIFGQ